MELALNEFHRRHSDVSLLLNVRRHPYSFLSDRQSSTGFSVGFGTPEGQEPTWHDALLKYCDGSYIKRWAGELLMSYLARRAGIRLDFGVQAQWQPIDSQRAMLWAGRFGKQEEYMSALARRHFEEKRSASHRSSILDAVAEAGLDRNAAAAFLDTDELKDVVWQSYGSTIREKGIHSIPLFVFNSPLTDGGPFGTGQGKAVIINGSGDEAQFLQVFDSFLGDMQQSDPATWGGASKAANASFSLVGQVIAWWCKA